MSIITLQYQDHAIAYQDDGWFNATQAAAKFGKEPAQWARLPATQEYLQALESKYGKNTYLKTKRGQAGGTWLHPRLAVMFARWLDVDFAIWCDEQIDLLVRGKDDWRKLRHQTASSFKVANDILKLVRQDAGKATEPHHYSNEARLVNWALAGEFKGIDRNALQEGELSLLAYLEERNAVLIGRGLSYDQRKPTLKQYAMDWRMERAPIKALTARHMGISLEVLR